MLWHSKIVLYVTVCVRSPSQLSFVNSYRCQNTQRLLYVVTAWSVIVNGSVPLLNVTLKYSPMIFCLKGTSWSWLYSSWINYYLCNQCLSQPSFTLWVWILLTRRVLDQTLCVCQWFCRGTLASSTNKTDRHDITEILLKVASSTITVTPLFCIY